MNFTTKKTKQELKRDLKDNFSSLFAIFDDRFVGFTIGSLFYVQYIREEEFFRKYYYYNNELWGVISKKNGETSIKYKQFYGSVSPFGAFLAVIVILITILLVFLDNSGDTFLYMLVLPLALIISMTISYSVSKHNDKGIENQYELDKLMENISKTSYIDKD